MSHNDEQLILLVVGAHLDAERHDRPLASQLRDEITRVQKLLKPSRPAEVITCTDVWYLNDQSLLGQPVIAIGQPEQNAATAFLASRVPTALIIDDAYRIHLDAELIELRACIWGTTPGSTRLAVDAFQKRYLEAFVRSVHDLPVGAG